jgi:hypothetical protein
MAFMGSSENEGIHELQGGCAEDQLALFNENQGDDNARYLE